MSAQIPILIGSATRLTPQPGAVVQKNAFGIDVLNRPFSCPQSLVQTSIPAPGTPDRVYTNLRATGNYSITEGEGLICTINVEYKGLLNGSIPDVPSSGELGTGQLSATSGSDGSAANQRTWDLVFRKPVRVYRYITSGRPTGPRFNSYEGGPAGSPAIITQSIRDGTGRPRSSAPGISLVARAELERMTDTPVIGTPFYEVEEAWAGVFVLQS